MFPSPSKQLRHSFFPLQKPATLLSTSIYSFCARETNGTQGKGSGESRGCGQVRSGNCLPHFPAKTQVAGPKGTGVGRVGRRWGWVGGLGMKVGGGGVKAGE